MSVKLQVDVLLAVALSWHSANAVIRTRAPKRHKREHGKFELIASRRRRFFFALCLGLLRPSRSRVAGHSTRGIDT